MNEMYGPFTYVCVTMTTIIKKHNKHVNIPDDIDRLVQDCSNSTAIANEVL